MLLNLKLWFISFLLLLLLLVKVGEKISIVRYTKVKERKQSFHVPF